MRSRIRYFPRPVPVGNPGCKGRESRECGAPAYALRRSRGSSAPGCCQVLSAMDTAFEIVAERHCLWNAAKTRGLGMSPENQPWFTGRSVWVCTDILRVPLCLNLRPCSVNTVHRIIPRCSTLNSALNALQKYSQVERVHAARNQKARSEKGLVRLRGRDNSGVARSGRPPCRP